MIVISQDGLKAIDAKEIQYYFIAKEDSQNTLMVMPKIRTPEINQNFLKIFSDKNLDLVKHVMKFLISCEKPSKNSIMVEVTLDNLKKLGMKNLFDDVEKNKSEPVEFDLETLKATIETLSEKMKTHIIEIGKRLNFLKKEMRPDIFEKFLKDKFNLSLESANKFIETAKSSGADLNDLKILKKKEILKN